MKRPQHLIHGHLHNLIHKPIHKLLRTLALVIMLALGTPTAWAVDWDELAEIAKQTTPTTLQRLADAVAQYNAERDGRQYTPLHWAAWYNTNPEVITALVDAGADVMARDENGDTPLHRAAGNTNPDVIKALIVAGADVNVLDERYINTPLHRMANTNFLGWGDMPDSNIEGVKLLLAAGADVNIQDEDGMTPLYYAADGWFFKPESIKVLLAAGADVNIQDKHGRTPLHRAEYNRDYAQRMADGSSFDMAASEESIRMLRNGISAADRERILAEIAQIRTELEGGGETVAQTQNTGQNTGQDTGDGIGIMEMTITDACAEGRGIQYRLFGYANAQPQGQYIGILPSGDKVFTLPEGGTATVTRNCKVEQTNKIVKSWCFGGTPKPNDGNRHWGVGIEGDKGCEDCCGICPSEGTAEFSYNFTCGEGAQRSKTNRTNNSASTSPSYSSVADTIAQSTRGGWAIGYAIGHASAVAADKAAIEICEQYDYDNGGCAVVHRFRGQGCVALAKSSGGAGGWGAGHATLAEAEQRAVNECNKADGGGGNNCDITDRDCTDG